MFSGQNSWQDANRGYQISPDDLQTLVQLAGKYGPINLMFFLRSIGETCAFHRIFLGPLMLCLVHESQGVRANSV